MNNTTKILLVGANGKLGHVIAESVAQKDNCSILAGIDHRTESYAGFPIYNDFSQLKLSPDVIIDFSHPSVLDPLLDYAVKNAVPCVISTTGYSIPQITQIENASCQIPIFFTANMSLGVNLLSDLAKKAAQVLGTDFDIEIVERHHNQKIDAPSGTALMLANEINGISNNRYTYVYDRQSKREKRTKHEIGFSSVRGGTIVGDHDIIFAGLDEVITISHSAYSKSVFATGSINAALFLARQSPGLYKMQDLIERS